MSGHYSKVDEFKKTKSGNIFKPKYFVVRSEFWGPNDREQKTKYEIRKKDYESDCQPKRLFDILQKS